MKYTLKLSADRPDGYCVVEQKEHTHNIEMTARKRGLLGRYCAKRSYSNDADQDRIT